MIWLSRTCFSLALAAAAHAGIVSGEFELIASNEATVMRQKDYSGVVVWLEPVGGPAPLAQRRSYTINQKNKRFTPHVLAVPIGSELNLPNGDPIFHNAFSTFSGQPFDTGLYPPGSTQKVVLRRSGVVRIFCNIHSNMSAVVVVTPTPWLAVTGKDGRFTINDAPAGEYQLRVWHERSTDASLRLLERRVRIGDSATALGRFSLSEAGHVGSPHKNKFGKDYPVDEKVYPGGVN